MTAPLIHVFSAGVKEGKLEDYKAYSKEHAALKEVVAVHGGAAYQFLEHGSERSDAFGPLNDATAESIRQFGVELRHHPYHLGGFTRLRAHWRSSGPARRSRRRAGFSKCRPTETGRVPS